MSVFPERSGWRGIRFQIESLEERRDMVSENGFSEG